MHGLLIEDSAHEFHRDAELHGLAAKCGETALATTSRRLPCPKQNQVEALSPVSRNPRQKELGSGNLRPEAPTQEKEPAQAMWVFGKGLESSGFNEARVDRQRPRGPSKYRKNAPPRLCRVFGLCVP